MQKAPIHFVRKNRWLFVIFSEKRDHVFNHKAQKHKQIPLWHFAYTQRALRLIFQKKMSPNNYKKNKGDKSLPYFVVKKLITQSQRYKMGELKRAFHYLLDAEISLKTGCLLPDIVLEQLVIKIIK